MNSIEELFEELKSYWQLELFKFGENAFSLKMLAIILLAFFLLFFFSSLIKRVLIRRVFPRYGLDIGTSQAIATIIRYVLIVLGIIIILQTSGIDLSSVGIMFGALGVGIGFGLQNITNNFISGIIILFERPIKVGDRIEVGDLAGNVVEISARSTMIITNDNIAVIVPNSDFINSRVINWSHNSKKVRINIQVGVSYNEDPEKIRQHLIQVALENQGVLREPAPYILFKAFGDSSLDFTLQVWTTNYIDKPNILKSELYYAIFRKFRESGVEIPFPQRDIHIRSGLEFINKESMDDA